MKKLIHFSLFFFFLISFLVEIQAECATVHFYRKNGLQSDRTLYLFKGSEQIATVNLGERYKATICSDGNYSFVVKLDPSDMSIYKKTINVQQGQDYFVKLNCLIGADLPTIAKMDTGKGRKEWNRNAKFIGQIKQLQIGGSGNNGGYVNNSSVSSGSNVTQSNGTFQRTQIVNNFKFEIVDMTKAGGLLTLSYKITNLAPDDRQLETCAALIHFYDDLGNLVFPNQTCIANSCRGYNNGYQKVQPKFNCNGTSRAIMPSGIPLNAKIVITDINKRATKFLKGVAVFKAENPFEITYTNIEFPTVIDTNNPNKRNLGTGSMELIEVRRDGENTIAQFKFQNLMDTDQELKIEETIIYDDRGDQHSANGISFVNYSSKKNRGYAWKYMVNSNGQIYFYVNLKTIKSTVKQLPRFTLNLGKYKLDWENISIKKNRGINQAPVKSNQGSSNNSSNKSTSRYINFNDLESNLSNYESTVGSKVILDNIYFSSGKDELLQASMSQLQELTRILKGNNFVRLSILGHTDDIGNATSNMLLSQKRADTIRYYLIQEGIDPARMTSLGKGENTPLATNSTVDGRQMNRRVEIELTK